MPVRPCTRATPCLVLLVENDDRFRTLFEIELESSNERRFRMVPARSLEEMRGIFESGLCIDAVLLDLGLTTSFGADTLRLALEITRHRVPVIVLTGGSDLSEEDALAMGAAAYCEKVEVNQRSLLKIVRQAIGQQSFITPLLDLKDDYERAINPPDKSAGLEAVENLKTGIGKLLQLVRPA